VTILTIVLVYVVQINAMVSATNRIPIARYTLLRFFANSTPTDETFLQCGHLARAFVNVLN
jgi:hypothetical protein